MGNAGIILLNKYDSDKNLWVNVHKIIKTDSFEHLSYSPQGIIRKFQIAIDEETTKVFQPHFYENEDGKYAYYFNRDHYLEYKLGNRELKNIEIFDNFEYGTEGDTIKIYKRILDLAPECGSLCYQTLEWEMPDDEDEITLTNGEVVAPIDATEGDPNCYILNEPGLVFFETFSIELKLGKIVSGSYDIEQMHNLIANISQLITKIDQDILQVFLLDNPLVGTLWVSDIDIIVDEQKTLKLSSPHDYYLLKTKSDFLAYYSKLHKYYNGIKSNLYTIENEDDIGKFANFLINMHPVVLSRISVEDKLDLLDYIVNFRLMTSSQEPLVYAIDQFTDLELMDRVEAFENLVVSICGSFTEEDAEEIHSDDNTYVDVFLKGLLKMSKAENITMYEMLYNKMSTSFNITRTVIDLSNWVFETEFVPKDTRGAFVQTIYLLWGFSKFNPYDGASNLKSGVIGTKILNPALASFDNENHDENQNCLFYYSYEKANQSEKVTVYNGAIYQDITYDRFSENWNNASPIIMPYESEKEIGIFWDNFSFEIDGDRIKAFQYLTTSANTVYPPNGSAYFTYNKKHLLHGIYDLYQPVSLLNYNVDTKVPILSTTGQETEVNGETINSVIPVFMLQYVDDIGDRSDKERMLGYIVDGILTFSGIGNLSKLKHLRWFALGGSEVGLFTKTGLRVLLGGVEFASGVLGYFANFVECDEDDEWCKHFKEFITLFEISASLVSIGDSLVSLALKRKAANLIDKSGGGETDAEMYDNLKNKLDEVKGPDTSTAQAEETAEKIKDLGREKYLNRLDDLADLVDEIYQRIYSKLLKRIESNSVFHKKFFKAQFGEDNIKRIIQDCIEQGIHNEKHMHDIILMSCRAGKTITFEETRTIIYYYTKVVRSRGFPTGFHSLADYKLFSNKVKTFLDEYCRKWGIKNARYEIQGSVQFKSHPSDPNVGDVPVFTRDGAIMKPDDLDGRIYITRGQANKFLEKIENAWRYHFRNAFPDMSTKKIQEKVLEKMIPLRKKAEKGMIYKASMPPPPEETFISQLGDAVKRDDGTDIFYPLSSRAIDPSTLEAIPEVGFSIIIKNSDYDIDPVTSLKF